MAQFIIPTVFTAVNQMRGPLAGMERDVMKLGKTFQDKLQGIGDKAIEIGVETGIAGAAMLGPIGAMINSAVEFDDKMADIAKTTGLAGVALQRFGNGILDISKTTRSSIDDLLQIGEIGGQLGVASNELLSFVSAADKFNIALGKDYQGGVEQAITQVGKLNSLFKDTRNLRISESITRTGSVINELGAQGAATSQNMNDFILRVGALPDALKPSFTAVSTLSAFLEEMGVNSEVGASGFTQLMLDASRNLQGFAAQMKITKDEAMGLLSQDPLKFAQKFAESTKNMAPDKLAMRFKELSIASGEEIKVIGALASGTERMNALQAISNRAFAQGTSLLNEAAKKNDTLRAKMDMARNNFQALSITIGTQLIPIVSAFLDKTIPVVSTIAKWVSNHKDLTRTILKVVAVTGLFVSAVSLVSLTIGAAAKATVLWKGALIAYNFVSGIAAVRTGTLTGEILANTTAAKGAQFALGGYNKVLMNIGLTAAGVLSTIIALNEQMDKEGTLSRLNPLKLDFNKDADANRDKLNKFHISDAQFAKWQSIYNKKWMDLYAGNGGPVGNFVLKTLKSSPFSFGKGANANADSAAQRAYIDSARNSMDSMMMHAFDTQSATDSSGVNPVSAVTHKQENAVNVYVNVDKDGNVTASSKTIAGAVPVSIRQTGGAPIKSAMA